MNFSWIDIIVILLVIRGVIVGYRRGFSGEALRFLGVILALFLSFKFYEPGANRLIQGFGVARRTAIAISFGTISLAVIVFFYLLNRMMQHLMELPLVAAMERGGGAVFGGLKALLFAFVVLIVLALVKVEAVSNAVSRDSFFGALAISSVPGAYRIVTRVYPEAESSSAEKVLEKLPAVKQRTELNFFTDQGGTEAEHDSDYIEPAQAK